MMTTPHFPPQSPLPAPPRRRGLKIYAFLVTLLFAGSLFVIFVLLMFVIGVLGSTMGGSGRFNTPANRVSTEVLVSGGSDQIAILPISGSIDDRMYDYVRNYCDYIKNDRSIKAVIIEVDSPGGGVTASDEIYHELMELKKTHKLVVSMRSLAASGGYYVSMAADKLYAEPTTLTGSIGVIWPSFQVTDMMQKIGVKPEFIKSSNASDYKDAGSPFKEMTDEDRDYIRGLLNNMHDKFAVIVSTGRSGKLTKPIQEIAVGKIWTADDAKTLGLIDGIAYLDEVCANTASDAGLHNPTIIRLKNRLGLLEALSASSVLGGGKVEVNLNPRQLENSGAGSMEFRFTGTR